MKLVKYIYDLFGEMTVFLISHETNLKHVLVTDIKDYSKWAGSYYCTSFTRLLNEICSSQAKTGVQPSSTEQNYTITILI